jgi:DNA-binding winged helix-turn-helix (wHTH) protein/TolB-like protein
MTTAKTGISGVLIRCIIIVIVSGRIQFGLFDFDPGTGDLSRDGRPVRLQRQPARVLALLTALPGELVSREQLRQQVWGDGTYVDFERGLNFCIAQIRAALGDSADSPRFVETLPRRGYRFIAPVRPATVEARVATRPAVSARHLLAGALALGSLILVAMLGAAAGGDARVRVAVVPFDNETGDIRFAGLGEGIADATVARLAAPDRVGRLAVVGNSAALRRPRSFRDLQAIGREASVDYVVLAQVKRDATTVRLIAHLIRVADESHLWAQTFDRDSFTLQAQSEIAETIASAVARHLIAD